MVLSITCWKLDYGIHHSIQIDPNKGTFDWGSAARGASFDFSLFVVWMGWIHLLLKPVVAGVHKKSLLGPKVMVDVMVRVVRLRDVAERRITYCHPPIHTFIGH